MCLIAIYCVISCVLSMYTVNWWVKWVQIFLCVCMSYSIINISSLYDVARIRLWLFLLLVICSVVNCTGLCHFDVIVMSRQSIADTILPLCTVGTTSIIARLRFSINFSPSDRWQCYCQAKAAGWFRWKTTNFSSARINKYY